MGGQTPLQTVQEMKDSAISLEMPGGSTDGGPQQQGRRDDKILSFHGDFAATKHPWDNQWKLAVFEPLYSLHMRLFVPQLATQLTPSFNSLTT